VLKKGAPENSLEAKTCLLGGKKLKEAKVTFALDEQSVWSFGLEADEFLVRGLKLPQGEGQIDAVSRFQERMIFLEQWREMFLDLFGAFTALRTDARKWKKRAGGRPELGQGPPEPALTPGRRIFAFGTALGAPRG
jgi:hypothetical protein